MKRLLLSLFAFLLLMGGTVITLRAGETGREEDEGNAPLERLQWFYGPRAYPNGIPNGARLKALNQLRSMSAAKKRDDAIRSQSTTWQPAGPTNAGGRIVSIAFDASTPTVYIGAAEGGVWKGISAGGSSWTWTPLTDKADALATGALAIDPNDKNILYAGTGEWSAGGWGGSFITSSPLYAGAGILKTTDGGVTWKNMGLQLAAAFSRIIVNPDNSQIVWAATNRGLWQTSDGGNNWTAMVRDSAVSDIALDPSDHTKLYIACSNSGVFSRLVDDSTTFKRMSTNFPTIDTSIGRIALSISNGGGNTVIYAFVATQSGAYKGIYKYGGNFWAAATNPSSSIFSNNQGWYDITIAADPADANHILAGGVTMYSSANGGTSWTQVGGLHADNHMITFDQTTGFVLVGNDGGIYLSENGGQSFTDISSGLGITQWYGIDVEPTTGGNIYGGAQDNGSWMGSSAPWSQIGGGDGGATGLDATNSKVYTQALAPYHSVYSVRTDGGGSSELFNQNMYASDREPWVHPLTVDKSNGTLFFGTNRLFRNAVGGSLTVASGDLTRGGVISAIGVSPNSPITIWTGSSDGLVFVTTDGGTNWKNVSAGLPGRSVSRVHPISNTTAYLALSGFGPAHVLKTTNTGDTWTDISVNMPDIPVNAFAIDPDQPTHLFIGTDIGVMYSIDDGGSWIPYMDGLPNVVVTELVVQSGSKKLFAATYGRSTWSAPMTGTVIALGSPVYGPLWFTNQTYPIVWYGVPDAKISYSTDGGATWIVIDQNQPGPTYQWDVPSGISTTTALVKVENGSTTLISDPFSIRPPTKGDVLSTLSRPYVPYGLAFDGNSLWSSSFYEQKIYKLDPDYMIIRDTIPTPKNAGGISVDSCTGLCWNGDDHVLYVSQIFHDGTGNANKVYMLDTLGVVKKTFALPKTLAYPTGLAYDGASLYVVDRDGSKIWILDPQSGATQGSNPDPVGTTTGPRGLSYLGNNLFLHINTVFNPNLSNAFLYRMELTGSGWIPRDTLSLIVNGSAINARAIEKDTRFPNTYWVSDFGTGTSGSIYRIVGFDVQSLEVKSPAAQVVWSTGTSQTIRWSDTRVDSIFIELSVDNGATWSTIAPAMPASSGQYIWTVPSIPTSATCKIRVSATGTNAMHSTSPTFKIQNGVAARALQIAGPSAGIKVKGLSTYNISWTSASVTTVMLEYTINGGTTWSTIQAAQAASAGTYAWTVPDSETTHAKLRVSSVDGTPTLQSESPEFEIQLSSAVAEKSISPDGFELYQNYPNPFNPSTEISFMVPRASHVTLSIYDAEGNEVRKLVDGEQSAGTHRVTFDGSKLASGSYSYVLSTASSKLTRSMIMTK